MVYAAFAVITVIAISLAAILSFSTAKSFVSGYQLSVPNSSYYSSFTSPFNVSKGACSYNGYTKAAVVPNKGLLSPPTNFSDLDQSVPFAYLVNVVQLNSSAEGAAFYNSSTGSLCGSQFSLAVTNATVSTFTLPVNNTAVHIAMLTNFTDAGLNATSNQYLGSKPNLYWYHASALYKNRVLVFSVWGFAPYQNTTLYNNLARGLFGSFASRFG